MIGKSKGKDFNLNRSGPEGPAPTHRRLAGSAFSMTGQLRFLFSSSELTQPLASCALATFARSHFGSSVDGQWLQLAEDARAHSWP